MPVGYRKADSFRQDDVDYGDRAFILRFRGFQRTKEGGLVIKEQTDFSGEGTVRKVYWDVEIVWPEDLRGLRPGFSTPLKGINFESSEPGGELDVVVFTIAGEWTPWLLKRASDFGFDLKKLDPDDPFFDPSYIEKELELLDLPLSVAQVLERVIEPKLLEADRWVRAKCNPGSHWVDGKSVEPLTEAEEAELRRRIQELERSEAQTAGDKAAVIAELKQLMDSGAVSLSEIKDYCEQSGWTIDRSKPLVAQLSAEQLRKLVDTFKFPF